MMLKRVFDIDNPVMQGLGVAFNLMLLNILAIIAALPVITAGASLTALFDISLRLVRHEDIYIVRKFLESFRQNLKKGTILGIVFMIAAILLAADYAAASRYIPALRFLAPALAIVMLPVAVYSFGLLAGFENSIRNTIKNAAMLTAGFFPRTMAVVTITLIYYLGSMRFQQIGMPLMILFGLSLPVYIYAVICDPIFKTIEK